MVVHDTEPVSVVPPRILEASRTPVHRAHRPSRAKLLLAVADSITVVLAGAVAPLFLHRWDPGASEASWQLFWATVATVPIWIALFSGQRLYNTRFIGRRIDEVHRIVNATFLGTLSVAVAASLANVLLRRAGWVMLALCAVVLVTLEREIARRLFTRLRTWGRMSRELIVAGANP